MWLSNGIFIDKLFVAVQPNNSVTAEDSTAQFTAIASGISTTSESNFMYQWRKRNISVLPNKVSGINEQLLTIPNVVKSDEGLYYCIVINEWNRSVESDDVTLLVQGIYYIMYILVGIILW